jgi:hypothetical protein
MVASGLVPAFIGGVLSFLCAGNLGSGRLDYGRLQHGPAKLHDTFQNILRGLANDNFFAAHERENGIGSLLDELDQIRIDDERVIVEASEFNQCFAPARSSPALSLQ